MNMAYCNGGLEYVAKGQSHFTVHSIETEEGVIDVTLTLGRFSCCVKLGVKQLMSANCYLERCYYVVIYHKVVVVFQGLLLQCSVN